MTEEYLAARRLAGTPEGVAYAKRLEVMSPADAAAEIAGMFCLCADEDLEYEIACDLQLNSQSAKRIAVEIRRDRERDWNDYLKQLNPADAAAKIVNTYTGIEDEDLTDKIASRLNCDRSRAEEIAVEIRRLLETEWRERRAYPRRLEGMSPADAAKEIDRYLVMWLTADENLPR